MALISSFEPIAAGQAGAHKPVECGWKIFTDGGKTYLQMDTYGSNSREMRGKVSQSIQVDEAAARELHALLLRAFPSLGQP